MVEELMVPPAPFGYLKCWARDKDTDALILGAKIEIPAFGLSSLTGTTSDGAAWFPNVPIGSYFIKGSKSGYSTFTSPTKVTINEGAIKFYTVILQSIGTGTLKGHVYLNGTTSGIPGVLVQVKEPGTMKVLYQKTTDVNGYFDFGTIAAQVYFISLSKTNYKSVDYTHTVNSGTNPAVSLHIESTLQLGTFGGQVYKAGSIPKEAIANATVELVGTTYKTITSASGYFSMKVPTGNYTIKVTATGYETYSDSISFDALQGMNMSIPLIPPSIEGDLWGLIKAVDGTPIYLAKVTLKNVAGQTFSDTTGRYHWSHWMKKYLPFGTYLVTVEATGYLTISDVEVTININKVQKDFTMTPSGEEVGDLYIDVGESVTPESRNPIIGAKVTIDNTISEFTSETGRAYFKSISAGTHEVYVEADGYRPKADTVFVEAKKLDNQKLILLEKFAEPGQLAGIITDSILGYPIADATVELVDTDYATSTDVEGYYNIDGLQTGEYVVRVSASNYLGQDVPITFIESEGMALDVKLWNLLILVLGGAGGVVGGMFIYDHLKKGKKPRKRRKK